MFDYLHSWYGVTTVDTKPKLDRLPHELKWVCNICGARNLSQTDGMGRESGSCKHCHSVMRFRSLMAVLTLRLFGEVKTLKQMRRNPAFHGIGMSDDARYAKLLAERFSFTNTYYHCEPLLDITNPDPKWFGTNDFVITSDVFEHVPPPIQSAFDNLFALLKPGGVVVFSVPYSLENATREHFPNLDDFELRQEAAGNWVLHNLTRDGVKEQFRDLVFHGGPGSTLEMRLFCLSAVKQHLHAAGFIDIRVHDEPHLGHGIFWLHPWSLVISALRPA